MNKWISLAVVSVLLSPLLSATDAREQKEAINKLKQAVSRTNFFGLPSFRLTANVKIENQGNPLEGAYRLLWNGPEKWREEISLPGIPKSRLAGMGKSGFNAAPISFPWPSISCMSHSVLVP